jgi:hypothetical protein
MIRGALGRPPAEQRARPQGGTMDHPAPPITRRLAAGEVLFRQGDPPGPLYVLRRGSVAVVLDGLQVTELTLPGTAVGEISRLLDRPRGADVVATSDCELDQVEDVVGWFRADAERPLAVARQLARRLVEVGGSFVEARRALVHAGGRLPDDEKHLPPELDPVRRYLRALRSGT